RFRDRCALGCPQLGIGGGGFAKERLYLREIVLKRVDVNTDRDFYRVISHVLTSKQKSSPRAAQEKKMFCLPFIAQFRRRLKTPAIVIFLEWKHRITNGIVG